MKVLVHQIFRFCVVMLFAIFGTSMVLAGPLVASNITYFQTETTPVGQADDVGFAARAPPLAVTNVKVTGGVTVVYGSAFALYGQETVTALLGFDADHIAPNRGVTEFVDGVTVTNIRTGQTFTGTVDLRPTLNRIDNGGSFPHRNDGSTFGNREGRLPPKPNGYYTEYVHPTPGINGPGPQRIVVGQGGEKYYTPNHYSTFIPLN